MRNVNKGEIFKLKDVVPIKKNQTISKRIDNKRNVRMILFGLEKDTDISEELYEDDTIYILIDGKVCVGEHLMEPYTMILNKRNYSFDITALEDSILLEISFESEENKMKNIAKGEVIKLADALEYVEGGIANLDIVNRDDLKMMIMAIDEGEGLAPHTPPGDALVMPLEGEARLTIEGEVFDVKVGEQLVFPKGKVHSVEAKTKYKMLLTIVK